MTLCSIKLKVDFLAQFYHKLTFFVCSKYLKLNVNILRSKQAASLNVIWFTFDIQLINEALPLKLLLLD